MPAQQFSYQHNQRFFAQLTDGTEEVATAELLSLGAADVKPGYRGVYFSADSAALYRITYCAAVITRVFAPLFSFDCHSAKYLYKRAREVDWPALFPVDRTFAVFANVSNSAIRHSQYAALQVKDAIADRFRDEMGRRPNVSPHDADVRVNLHVQANKATLSLELGGGSMHRRGYRSASVDAPMMEHVAAAAVRMTGWEGERPLIDPMCGSGTLLAEALMYTCRVPSGYLRADSGLGLAALPDFDESVWREVRSAADAAIRPFPEGLLSGSDAAPPAVAAARENLGHLPGGRDVTVSKRRFEDLEPIEGATILCNPPYGLRLGSRDAMPDFMRSFGDFLKQRCTGSTAWIYFGKRELLKSLGLRSSARRPLANGGLDGRLVKIDLY